MPYVNGEHYDFNDPVQKKAYFRDYQREYRKKNLEKLQQYAKDYIKKRIETNPDYKAVCRQQRKKWYDAHREEVNERLKVRARQHWRSCPEFRAKRLAYSKNRYATEPQYRENMLNRFKQRYRHDEEFREKMKAYTIAYRQRKREEKKKDNKSK